MKLRCFLIFLIAGVLAVVAAKPLGPRLQLAADRIDFGRIGRSASVTDSVAIVNTGDMPLVITRLSSDCGCAAATAADREVMPLDTLWLKVTFHPEDRAPGFFRRMVRIQSNAVNPRETLMLTGTVTAKTDSVK